MVFLIVYQVRGGLQYIVLDLVLKHEKIKKIIQGAD